MVVVVVVWVDCATARVNNLNITGQLVATGHNHTLVLPSHPAVVSVKYTNTYTHVNIDSAGFPLS